jgi:type III secretion system needle length determinant
MPDEQDKEFSMNAKLDIKAGSSAHHIPSSDQSRTGLPGKTDAAVNRDADRFARALAGRSGQGGAAAGKELWPFDGTREQGKTGHFEEAGTLMREQGKAVRLEEAGTPVREQGKAVRLEEAGTPVREQGKAVRLEEAGTPVREQGKAGHLEEAGTPVREQGKAGHLEEAGTPVREQSKTGRPNTPDVLANRDSSLPSGDSILAALHEGRPDHAQQAGGPNLAAASQVKTASRPGESLVSQLAERILVSAPDAAGDREVRILLRENVLPGTEIRIQRQEGGALSVSFVTNDLRAEQILGGGALSDLHNALAGKLQVEVQVRIVRPDGGLTAEADGHSDPRQSGDGQGGSRDERHEGRSRQHDLYTGLRDEG